MTAQPSRPAPRLEIRELCAVCGKTILPGHATRESVHGAAAVIIHARCHRETDRVDKAPA
jgi:hypothetical protein